MAMPSRKRLTWGLLIGFLLVFVVGIIWYLSPLFFTNTVNEDGTTERSFNLFPFGGGSATPGAGTGGLGDIFGSGSGTLNPSIQQDENGLPRLRKITDGPVIAGIVFPTEDNISEYSSEAEGKTLNSKNTENTIRYVELGTGHVFEGSTNELEVKRVSNTTIPKINEAMFVNPDRVLLRYEDDFGSIKTFSAELVPDFTESSGVAKKLQGIFLNDGIQYVSVSPDGKLFTLEGRPDGGVNGIVSDGIGENRAQVFGSQISEWRGDWQQGERNILLTSTPSYNTYGLTYQLDTQTGSVTPYAPGRLALQGKTSGDFSQAILSLNNDERPQMYVWSRDSNQYIELGLSSYAEKCVWAPNRQRFYCAVPINNLSTVEPDLWYQGVTQNDDEIWEIDPDTGFSSLIVSPFNYTEEDIDVVDLAVTPDERYLYFRNKSNRSMWTYRLFETDEDVIEVQEGSLGTEEEFFE